MSSVQETISLPDKGTQVSSAQLAFRIALGGLLALGALGCGSEPAPPTKPLPPIRPSAFRACPKASAGALPPGFVPKDRLLRNLGDNIMGHSIIYRSGVRQVSVHVGYDAVDPLEDVDFVERPAVVGGRRVTILTPGALPKGRLRVASWEDVRLSPSCRRLTVIASSLTEREFLGVVAGVEVESG